MKVFVEDPQIFLTQMEIPLSAYDNTDEMAVLTPDHASRINWETYFFSCRDEKAVFDADPLASCGLLTDPVTRERFKPESSSPRIVHDSTQYFFSSDSTLAVFVSMPDSLATPAHRMLPRSDG